MNYGRIKLGATAVAVAMALSACGGGGSHGLGGSLPTVSTTPSVTSSAAPVSGTASAKKGTASFSITVPAAGAAQATATRKPQYISPNTGSIRISVLSVNGASVQVPDTIATIAYGASGCSTSTATPLTCTVSAIAPVGQMVAFRISTYASADASGSVLATSTLSAAVTDSAGTPIKLSLGGVVDHVVISPTRFVAPTDGTLQTYLVSVTPVDASGATIVGSTPFASPFQLSVQNDPNGALQLTQTEITKPGEAVQLKFDSSKPVTDAKIYAATGSSSSTLQADFVTLSYTPNTATVDLSGSPVTVAVSEVGFTGQFTASVADSTVASATISPTTNGTATITISPPPPGSYSGNTTLTVSDGTTSGNLPIHVIYPMLQMQDWNVGGAPAGAMVANAPSSNGQFGGPSFFYSDPGMSRIMQFLTNGDSTIPVAQSLPDAAETVAVDANGNVWWVVTGWPQAQLCSASFFRGQYPSNCYNLTGVWNQANVWGLVADANGNMWMTLSNFGQGGIAQFNIASSTFTYYTTGMNSTANPLRMTMGPDGNVWFTDTSNTAPAIGKLTVSTGAITEYPLQAGNGNPGTASVPESIVTGPDGNLWFTDNSQFNGAIGKVIPSSGAITEYNGAGSGLQKNAMPYGITIGPDNNLWFTDPSSAAGQYLVGTVDASTGKVQEYSLSIPAYMPFSIISLMGNLEVMSPGIAGQPVGGYVGQIALPTTSAFSTARRSPASSIKR